MDSATVHLPAGLHRQLKIRAAEEGTALKEIVEAALREYLKKPGKEHKP